MSNNKAQLIRNLFWWQKVENRKTFFDTEGTSQQVMNYAI